MAKPRVFISSTYYDLKHIRKGLQEFINSLGYDSILFENGDIPFIHNEPLDKSCYKEVELSQILVLIIGGRYGSPSSDEYEKLSQTELDKHYKHYNSITKLEYETAKRKDIPIYIFIEKGVSSEYATYKKNKGNQGIEYAHVDNIQVFELIESIYTQHRNNLCRDFENIEDITRWLRDQWAGLFATLLQNQTEQKDIKSLESQVERLNTTINGLKTYSESIMRTSNSEDFESIIKKTNENIRFKNIEIALRDSVLFRHLIDSHKYEIDKIIESIMESKSIEEFCIMIENNMPKGESCGIVNNIDNFAIEEINKIREHIFGLKPFRKRKL
ncbi:DUF4062 domain-containing protein, partial [Flammeovirga sp. SJP92]|uniref:DUF4062 domain-containing protein n=1 Tax=Flammeovirga sp. SJP92 TaxID=1775430 RepID=UPI000788DAFE